MTAPRDDSLMSRFDRFGLRCFRARDAVRAVLLTAFLLIIFQGASVHKAAVAMKPGTGRDLVLAASRPSTWIADALPFASIAHSATAWLNPEPRLNGPGSFASARALSNANEIPPVTPDAFDPATIGERPPARRPLRTLLVTGDSMSQPLDSDIASQLASRGVRVIRDPHIGTGISTSFVVDWGQLSTAQVRANHPDAVVVFIGANDGFPMPAVGGHQVPCCSATWAVIYADRVRQIANNYRRSGAARVYWLTLPAPRDPARQRIARVVNAAIKVAVQPWADQIRVVDTVPIFTPGFAYRDAMTVGGIDTIVRQADGIHLNDAGSSLLANIVLRSIHSDFTY